MPIRVVAKVCLVLVTGTLRSPRRCSRLQPERCVGSVFFGRICTDWISSILQWTVGQRFVIVKWAVMTGMCSTGPLHVQAAYTCSPDKCANVEVDPFFGSCEM